MKYRRKGLFTSIWRLLLFGLCSSMVRCFQLTVCSQTQTSLGRCGGGCHWSRGEWCLVLSWRLARGSLLQSGPEVQLSPVPSVLRWCIPWPCHYQQAWCHLQETHTYKVSNQNQTDIREMAIFADVASIQTVCCWQFFDCWARVISRKTKVIFLCLISQTIGQQTTMSNEKNT